MSKTAKYVHDKNPKEHENYPQINIQIVGWQKKEKKNFFEIRFMLSIVQQEDNLSNFED